MLAVIIPAYNRPDCLRNALQSLTMQTKKMFMVYVIDDCSEEDLKSVCDEFKTLHLYYFRLSKNSGPAAARQYGLDIAVRSNIEYVMFLDSDDMYFPHTIERLFYEINHRFDDVVASNISVEKTHSAGKVISADFGAQTWLHGKIIRLKYLVDNNIRFNPNIKTNEDVNFLIKVMNLTKKKSMIDDSLYLWRDDKNSITRLEGIFQDRVASIDYILSVTDALSFLEEHGVDMDNYIVYVYIFYGFYQIGLIKGTVTDEVDKVLYDFIQNPKIKKNLKRYIIWEKNNYKFQQYFIHNKKIYTYPETFIEWFKRFDKEGEILGAISGD